MAQTSEDLLAVFDRAPLNARYWTSFALLGGVYVLDFFDFFLIAFILAVIGPSWHLTYGQAALILYGRASARSPARWSGGRSATCSAASRRPSPAP